MSNDKTCLCGYDYEEASCSECRKYYVSDREVQRAQQEDYIKKEMRVLAEELRDEMSILPKSLKCGTCGISCQYDKPQIDLVISTCKHVGDKHQPCKMKANYDFIQKLEKASNHKVVPALLLPHKKEPQGEIAEMMENIRRASNDTQNTWLPTRDTKETKEKVESGMFEMFIDDPINMFITKNGKVEYR